MAAALSASAAEVLLLEDGGASLRGPVAPGAVPLDEAPLAREVLARGEPAAIEDTSADPRAGRLDREERSLAVLLVPVASSRGARGVVTISDAMGRRFRDDEVALWCSRGSVADLALVNAAPHRGDRQGV